MTIPVAKDVYIRPTSISCLRICQSPATDVVVVACLRGVFFVSSLFAACSSAPFSLRKQFFYASRGFCPNGGKQRCGCSQMRQAGTSGTFDGFRYDGERGESWFRLVESEGDEWRWYLLGEETSDGAPGGKWPHFCCERRPRRFNSQWTLALP